ncbi:MAG: poly-beta-1,6 N-acetyl-D-glucosamine export porin PgaA [Xanthomonadaceae bacterium]|nr:poly-beta-1,6 N-acetyl-D-glucosamine export porin PgaA [Xanthomonadaceae bacterium]
MTARASGCSRLSAAVALAIAGLGFPAAPTHADDRLAELRAQLQQRPDDAALRAAAIVAAQRAGDDAYALQLFERDAGRSWPLDTLEAAARAARNQRGFARAAALFDEVLRRDPVRRSAAAGAAMSLAEAGDTAAANTRADELLRETGDSADLLLAAAYVRQRSGRSADALALYQRAQALAPASREAADGARAALADLGAAQAALEQGEPAAAERERLDTDRVAQAIRWADYAPERLDDRLAEARDALAAADANLAALPAAATEQRLRARKDRVLALRRLERMAEADAAARALRDDGAALPAYVQVAWADALLWLRRPREAIALYRAALQAQPQQTEVELSLMYAQLEAEDFAAARRTLDAAIAHNPPWTRAPGRARPLPNTDRARAELSLALLSAFGDDLTGAQRQLEALITEAPARTELQRELATVYLRRGWPRRALARYRIAQSLEREDVALRLDLIAVQRALGHYETVEPALRALEAEAPTHVQVQRQRADWDAWRGWQFDVGEWHGEGAASVFGNRERSREIALGTPLFADFWRVTVQQHRQRADVPEGEVAYDRSGLGLRYTRGPLDARVAWFDPGDGYSHRQAVEAALRLTPADRWWFGAQASTASLEAPLRARYYGITGRSMALSGGWRRSDLGELALNLSRLDLSDGNRRDAAAMTARERLLTQPHLKLDLRGEFGASRNSLTEAPYFNPSRDAIALAGISADWMSWRHYDNNLQQRFSVWAGNYWQRGHGGSGVLRANLEHEWQFGPNWSLRYGLGWFRQSYDGRRESRRELFATLHWGGLP